MSEDIWVGEFELVALKAMRPFWQVKSDRVLVRLISGAPNKRAFEESVRASVLAGGAMVSRVIDVYAAHQRPVDAAVKSAIQHGVLNTPTLVEDPAPAPMTRRWMEIDWDTLTHSPEPLWAIVSGVSWPEISVLIEQNQIEHARCLYSSLDQQTLALAPWLVELRPNCDISAAIQRRASEGHACVIFNSVLPIDALRTHFRRFTMIQTPDDSDAPVYFRFYDSRVLLDLIEAMSRPFLDRFLAPLSHVAVPLSPYCLMPDGATLTGPAITPFDAFASCHGRLLVLDVAEFGPARVAGALRVSQPDFDALTARMARRAGLKLARELHTEFGALVTAPHCLNVGVNAAEAAAPYGLTSIKQVGVFARCQLMIAHDFVDQYPKARRILTNDRLLAWQKKDELITWYCDQLLAPETIEKLENIA